MLPLLLIALGAYLLGSIPFGLLIAKSRGIDIRNTGSKNIGATNVWRVMGWRWGLPTFLFDFLKGLGAVLVAKWFVLAHESLPVSANVGGILAGVFVILGHNFPVWLKFKGGKGVATSLGTVFGLVPAAAGIAFGLWILIFLVSRYVSLASIIAAIMVPTLVAFYPAQPGKLALLIFSSVAAGLIVLRHRANIQRLLNGTESRFVKKS